MEISSGTETFGKKGIALIAKSEAGRITGIASLNGCRVFSFILEYSEFL